MAAAGAAGVDASSSSVRSLAAAATPRKRSGGGGGGVAGTGAKPSPPKRAGATPAAASAAAGSTASAAAQLLLTVPELEACVTALEAECNVREAQALASREEAKLAAQEEAARGALTRVLVSYAEMRRRQEAARLRRYDGDDEAGAGGGGGGGGGRRKAAGAASTPSKPAAGGAAKRPRPTADDSDDDAGGAASSTGSEEDDADDDRASASATSPATGAAKPRYPGHGRGTSSSSSAAGRRSGLTMPVGRVARVWVRVDGGSNSDGAAAAATRGSSDTDDDGHDDGVAAARLAVTTRSGVSAGAAAPARGASCSSRSTSSASKAVATPAPLSVIPPSGLAIPVPAPCSGIRDLHPGTALLPATLSCDVDQQRLAGFVPRYPDGRSPLAAEAYAIGLRLQAQLDHEHADSGRRQAASAAYASRKSASPSGTAASSRGRTSGATSGSAAAARGGSTHSRADAAHSRSARFRRGSTASTSSTASRSPSASSEEGPARAVASAGPGKLRSKRVSRRAESASPVVAPTATGGSGRPRTLHPAYAALVDAVQAALPVDAGVPIVRTVLAASRRAAGGASGSSAADVCERVYWYWAFVRAAQGMAPSQRIDDADHALSASSSSPARARSSPGRAVVASAPATQGNAQPGLPSSLLRTFHRIARVDLPMEAPLHLLLRIIGGEQLLTPLPDNTEALSFGPPIPQPASTASRKRPNPSGGGASSVRSGSATPSTAKKRKGAADASQHADDSDADDSDSSASDDVGSVAGGRRARVQRSRVRKGPLPAAVFHVSASGESRLIAPPPLPSTKALSTPAGVRSFFAEDADTAAGGSAGAAAPPLGLSATGHLRDWEINARALMRMRRMRQHLEHLRMLVDLVRRREKLKRERLKAIGTCMQGAIHAWDEATGAAAVGVLQPLAKRLRGSSAPPTAGSSASSSTSSTASAGSSKKAAAPAAAAAAASAPLSSAAAAATADTSKESAQALRRRAGIPSAQELFGWSRTAASGGAALPIDMDALRRGAAESARVVRGRPDAAAALGVERSQSAQPALHVRLSLQLVAPTTAVAAVPGHGAASSIDSYASASPHAGSAAAAARTLHRKGGAAAAARQRARSSSTESTGECSAGGDGAARDTDSATVSAASSGGGGCTLQ